MGHVTTRGELDQRFYVGNPLSLSDTTVRVYRFVLPLFKVGQEVSEEEAQEAARKVAIQLIATIKSESRQAL